MIEFLNTYGLAILGAALVASLGMVGRFIHRAEKLYLDTPAKIYAADRAVHYVEQVFRDFHGREKFDEALKTTCKWLSKHHIKWTEEELTVIIEAAVQEMNEFAKPPLLEDGFEADLQTDQQ